MTTKQRYQNPVVGDTIRLKFLTYSSNTLDDVKSIDQIDIYHLDENSITDENPKGKVLIDTISGSSVVHEATGKYYYDLAATKPKYIIGHYLDVWTITVEDETDPVPYENNFVIYPKLWYAATTPIVHDFSFQFTPNRMPKGSIKPIIVNITPQVPRGTDLEKYYTNIAIYSDVYINVAKKCDPCLPQEEDLRTIVDRVLIEDREKCLAFYTVDTSDDGPGFDCGLYDIWFEMSFGGNKYISDKNQLLVY